MSKIIHETSEHIAAVRQLTIQAFQESELGHNGEADLVDSIRNQCDDAISLVAIVGQIVVGHILFSPATIRTSTSIIKGMGLAPISVLPTCQHNGLGSMLVMEGLRLVAQTDAMFTIVAGHPAYYPRFGFRAARDFSVKHGFSGMSQDVLFLHPSSKTLANHQFAGLAFYHDAFGSQHTG